MTDQGARDQQIHNAMDLIMRMSRAHHRIVERRVSELGIHRSQHRMLMALAPLEAEHPPAQKELAERMDISPASAANMLKRLESGGYIARSVRSTDGRCNEVEITPRGRQVVEKSRRLFDEIDRQMFEKLSGEEIAALCGCVGKLQDSLRAMEAEMEPAEKAARENAWEKQEIVPADE